jgi:lipoprotein NlpI
MAKPPKIEVVLPEPETMTVEKPADYSARGWLYFSHKKFNLAADDFTHVVGMDAADIEAWYGLGLTLKSEGAKGQAVEAFEHVLNLLGNIQDHQRSSVLGRLVRGQINHIQTGDWNLEKEVWKSIK